MWLQCSGVKVIYMCHRTVTFRIHSTATTEETENSIKTHGAGLLGVSASSAMSPAHLGHWVSVSCQCQVQSWNANGPSPHCLSLSLLPPSLSRSLCSLSLGSTSEGGKAINSLLVVELCIRVSLCLYKRYRRASLEDCRPGPTLSLSV